MVNQFFIKSSDRHNSRIFVDFPPELLGTIFGYLDIKSITEAQKMSKLWRDVAASMILKIDRPQGLALAQKAVSGTFFGPQVRHISMDYSADYYDVWCVDAHAADILNVTPNLKSLYIRGHWDFAEDDPFEGGDGEVKPPWTDWVAERARFLAVLGKVEHLPNLESCTFHYRGCYQHLEHWGCEDHIKIFFNKNIKTLEFIHAGYNDDKAPIFQYDDGHHGGSGVEELIFKDCDISPAAFQTILCFPKALQELTYTFYDAYDFQSPPPAVKHATEFAEALLAQRKSLEAIHLQGLFSGELGARFGGMEQLKHLDIELGVIFGRDHPDGGYALNEIPINELLPPTLESLTLRYSLFKVYCNYMYNWYFFRFEHDRLRITAICRMLAAKETFLPRFQKLTLLRQRRRDPPRNNFKYQGFPEDWEKSKTNKVLTGLEDFCRTLNTELVDGGFYRENLTFMGYTRELPL